MHCEGKSEICMGFKVALMVAPEFNLIVPFRGALCWPLISHLILYWQRVYQNSKIILGKLGGLQLIFCLETSSQLIQPCLELKEDTVVKINASKWNQICGWCQNDFLMVVRTCWFVKMSKYSIERGCFSSKQRFQNQIKRNYCERWLLYVATINSFLVVASEANFKS